MQSKKKINALSIGFITALAVLLAFSQANKKQPATHRGKRSASIWVFSSLQRTAVFASDPASV